ncbi:unnamed protein product, partial [Parascedosporium putredinis]
NDHETLVKSLYATLSLVQRGTRWFPAGFPQV